VKIALQSSEHAVDAYTGLMAYLRECLSTGNDDVLEKFMNSGLFPEVMRISIASNIPDLTFEISWMLTNITCAKDNLIMKEILHKDLGLLNYLDILLQSEITKEKEHSLWCMSNILGSGEEYFEPIFTNTCLLDKLMELVGEEKLSIGLMRTTAWAVSNLCK
jgi:hypothetical protein